MNSDMVKPEKFSHLHLVYHFTVPLKHKNCVAFRDFIQYMTISILIWSYWVFYSLPKTTCYAGNGMPKKLLHTSLMEVAENSKK